MPINLQQALNKMFEIIGIKPPKNFDYKKSDWFTKYSWTFTQEQEYMDWFQEFLVKNWEGITRHKPRNKKQRLKATQEFVFQYGWKYMKKKIPFVAFGNNELDEKPLAGDKAKCPKCGKYHKIKFGTDKKTDKTSYIIGYVDCGKDCYMVSLNGRLI